MRISDWSSDVCSSDLGAAALLSSGLFQSEQEMPDEDDKKTAKPAEAAGQAPEGPAGEVSASEEGGDADQDALLAVWEAMAAEGDAEPAGEGARNRDGEAGGLRVGKEGGGRGGNKERAD